MKKKSFKLISKVLIFLFFLFPFLSNANDSSSCIGMGGLVFQKNAKIKMLSEELKISPDLIKVDYVYHNVSDEDIELLVAFPIPNLEMEHFHSGRDFPQSNWWNFKTLVNGNEIEWFPFDPNEKIKGWMEYPKSFKKFMIDKSIKKFNPFIDDDLNCSITENNPDNYLSIVRVQKFTANKKVKVQHSYSPTLGGGIPNYNTLTMKNALLEKDRDESEKKMDKSWLKCIDKKSAIHQLHLMDNKYEPEDLEWGQKMVNYDEVGYILKTGNNWNGPIEKFKLEITGSPPIIIQTCFKGLKKVSDNKYVFEAENYVPTENLNVTFHFSSNDGAQIIQ